MVSDQNGISLLYIMLENQTPHLQLQCEVSPAADNTDDATKDPDILQHLSEAHLQNPMVREDPK